MEKKEKTLKCKECGQEFIFSVNEQDFYEEKGFQNDPVRCPECRAKKKRERNSNNRY